MRPITGILILLVIASGAAFAEEDARGWKEYAYPDDGFSAQFPQAPGKSAGSYSVAIADGAQVTIPATVYSVQNGASLFTATVADINGTRADRPDIVEQAAKAFRGKGDIRSDETVSIANGQCGRDLTLAGRDGSQSVIAIFPGFNHRLYILQAKVPSARLDLEGGDAVRFQQSLSLITAEKRPPPDLGRVASWGDFTYPDAGFALRFPAKPEVALGAYKTAKGVYVSSTVYSVRQPNAAYSVTVADLWHTPADQPDAIDQAVRRLADDGEITSDVIVGATNAQCGRHLTIAEKNGSQSVAAVFFPTASHRLYILKAETSSASAAAETNDVKNFRQSLRFFGEVPAP